MTIYQSVFIGFIFCTKQLTIVCLICLGLCNRDIWLQAMGLCNHDIWLQANIIWSQINIIWLQINIWGKFLNAYTSHGLRNYKFNWALPTNFQQNSGQSLYQQPGLDKTMQISPLKCPSELIITLLEVEPWIRRTKWPCLSVCGQLPDWG